MADAIKRIADVVEFLSENRVVLDEPSTSVYVGIISEQSKGISISVLENGLSILERMALVNELITESIATLHKHPDIEGRETQLRRLNDMRELIGMKQPVYYDEEASTAKH